MNAMPMSLEYLIILWAAVTAVLTVLVIYGNTLSAREDIQLFLNKEEDIMMGSEQRVLVGKMHRLAETIFTLAIVSAMLLLASGAIWVWKGLF